MIEEKARAADLLIGAVLAREIHVSALAETTRETAQRLAGMVSATSRAIVDVRALFEEPAFVSTREGLSGPPLVEIDDRETSMTHADPLHRLPTESVRTSVMLDGRHRDEGVGIHGSRTVRMKDASDAAHGDGLLDVALEHGG